MSELTFTVALQWSGTGHEGIGTNAEELLVSAVAASYAATLGSVLRLTALPVASLSVEVTGSVSGCPGRARFGRLAVSPTILGGDPARRAQYEAAAVLAHTRCMVGNTLAREVTYEISRVRVRREETPAPNRPLVRANGEAEVAVRDAGEPALAWRSGE